MAIEQWVIRFVCISLVVGTLALVGVAILSRCSDDGTYETPSRIVKRERLFEGAHYEVWRVSEYHLHQVCYDTTFRQVTWDTAHEIPR